MHGWVANTDFGWYEFLSGLGRFDEVNFWRPSTYQAFHGQFGAPFFFKLKKPHYAICGFGFVSGYSRLPDWLAWECFGHGNGCASLPVMRDRVAKLRTSIGFKGKVPADHIGCIIIVEPVFFPRDRWVRQPADWSPRNLTNQRYDLTTGEGARVWAECRERAGDLPAVNAAADALVARGGADRYGDLRLVRPRLGQGAFRVAVTDAYERACAVTGEHSLPVLEAAHIKPFAENGPHELVNGLLLRADLHRLFDAGYVTVTLEHRLEVSSRLRADYENGHSYYPFHGQRVRIPSVQADQPEPAALRWHNEHRFLA